MYVDSKALKEVLGKLKFDKKTLFGESFGHLEYVCMIPPRYDLILQSYIYHFQASIIFVISGTSSTEILKCTPLYLVLGKLNFYSKLYAWQHVQRI